MTSEDRKRVGITIADADARGFLVFDLRDILALLPQGAIHSTWEVSGAEAVGPSARALHNASDSDLALSHQRLCEIAADITQTINGEFRAYRPGERDPWVIVRAVDSSAFDVISNDPAFIETVRARFVRVREYPPSEL